MAATNGTNWTFRQYFDNVASIIERKLGGRPKFSLDDHQLTIWDSYTKRHYPSVVAASIIEAELEAARSER